MPITRALSIAIAILIASGAFPTSARHVLPQHPRHAIEPPFTVQAFIHPNNHPYFLREPIEQSLSAVDVPYLHRVLADTHRHTQWDNALLALCVLEEGHRALETILGKVTAPWYWSEHEYDGYDSRHLLRTRIGYLWNVSMIDPNLTGSFLADLLSPEGAATFLESWGALPLPTEDKHGRDDLVGNVQRAAAYAIVYGRSPDQISALTAEFHRQARMSDERGYWRNLDSVFTLAEALAFYDKLQEDGWEEGLKKLRENQSAGCGVSMRPRHRQRMEEAAAILDAQPGIHWKRVVVRHKETWRVAALFTFTTVAGALLVWLVRRKNLAKLRSEPPAAKS